MNNYFKVKTPSLTYRLITREAIGVLCIIVLGALGLLSTELLKLSSDVLLVILATSVLFFLQLLIVFGVSFLEYSNLRYLLETNSISLREGVLYTQTETIPFDKIKNSSFDQSIIQRLFGVGDIVIDQDDEKYIWSGIDSATANTIMEAVSSKSNVQPISITSTPAPSQTPA